MTRFGKFLTGLPMLAAASLLLSGCGVFGGGGDEKTTPTIGERKSILSGESDVTVSSDIADIAVIIAGPIANRDWPQSGGNASKNLGHVNLPDTVQRAWTASIEGSSKRRRLAAEPVVSNGRLYTVDVGGVVHAFDAKSGARVWSTQIEVSKDGMPSRFGGGAAVMGDSVYATNGVGDVVALNIADGSQRWKSRPAGPLRGSPTVADSNVYVITQDNQIYALSAVDGEVEWTQSGTIGRAGIFGVASPASAQATVVAGFSSGELAAYRYENGRNLWNDALARTSISTSVATLSDIDADPVVDRGRVYALGQGGRMASYELSTGQRVWEINIAGISTPVVSGEWLFVLTDEAKLLCIARTNGKIRWISQLERWEDAKDEKGQIFWTGPVLAGNRLVVAGSNGQLVSVSPGDGSATMMADLKESVSLPPVVADNMLYVLDDGGRITAFR